MMARQLLLLLLLPAGAPSNLGAASNGTCFHVPLAGVSEPARAAHLLCEPAPHIKPRNELVLFFCGSGGEPPVPGAAFVQHALSLGFHFFGVSYADSPSVGAFCAARNYDPQCYSRIRTIRLDGGMYADNATCTEANGCVLPALGGMKQFETVLRATAGTRPSWKPFVGAKSKITWKSIVAAGESQGAGMALMLGIRLSLASVVQLAGVDDVVPSSTAPSGLVPAPWVVQKNKFATPPERTWGFGNVNGFCCQYWHATWPAAKLTGPLVSVDNGAAPPYGGSHRESTSNPRCCL